MSLRMEFCGRSADGFFNEPHIEQFGVAQFFQ
jgi:hypothetical protein